MWKNGEDSAIRLVALGKVVQGEAIGRGLVDRRIELSLIHISEPTRLLSKSYAVFCLKKKIKEHDLLHQQLPKL